MDDKTFFLPRNINWENEIKHYYLYFLNPPVYLKPDAGEKAKNITIYIFSES